MPSARTRTLLAPIFIHSTRSEVFRAITDPKILSKWFVDHATLEARKGGSYAFGWDGGPTHTGKVLDLVPNTRITLSWKWPGHEKLPATRLKMSVERKDGGTVLLFTHSGFGNGREWTALHEGAIRGWTYFMMNLKAFMETGKDLRSPDDW